MMRRLLLLKFFRESTAYVRGKKLTGTMKNNSAVAGTISSKDEQYTVPQGYHDGSGKVGIVDTEKKKLGSC